MERAPLHVRRHRAIAPRPLRPEDDFSAEVAGAWAALSPFKTETGIAVERSRIMYEKGLDPVLVYYAIATLAAQGRDALHPKAPYHAVLITEPVIRVFCARIGEVLRDIERATEGVGGRRPARGLVPLGVVMDRLAVVQSAHHSEGGRNGRDEVRPRS